MENLLLIMFGFNGSLTSLAKDLQVRNNFPIQPMLKESLATELTSSQLQTYKQAIGLKRLDQYFTVPLGVTVGSTLFYKQITTPDIFSEFSNTLASVFRGKRYRFKWTFFVSSIEQHIGAFYVYWYPGSQSLKNLSYATIYDAGSSSTITDLPGGAFSVLYNTPLDLSRAIQLDTFQMYRFGQSFSFTIETEWNTPFPFVYHDKSNNSVRAVKNVIPHGEFALVMMTSLTTNGQTSLPQFEVWKEVIVEDLFIPYVNDLTVPPI